MAYTSWSSLIAVIPAALHVQTGSSKCKSWFITVHPVGIVLCILYPLVDTHGPCAIHMYNALHITDPEVKLQARQ